MKSERYFGIIVRPTMDFFFEKIGTSLSPSVNSVRSVVNDPNSFAAALDQVGRKRHTHLLELKM
jgi:hypothetical protein